MKCINKMSLALFVLIFCHISRAMESISPAPSANLQHKFRTLCLVEKMLEENYKFLREKLDLALFVYEPSFRSESIKQLTKEKSVILLLEEAVSTDNINLRWLAKKLFSKHL